jgi:hypothetical protein
MIDILFAVPLLAAALYLNYSPKFASVGQD